MLRQPANTTSTTSGKVSKTTMIQNGKRRVHKTYPDGSEMVEEYDLKSDDLLSRKIKHHSILGSKWIIEVGEEDQSNLNRN
jgi:hypothetical protein